MKQVSSYENQLERGGFCGEASLDFLAVLDFFFDQALEITAVAAVAQLPGQVAQLVLPDQTHPIGDLLRAANDQPLTLFNRLDKIGGLQQGFMAACVQPGNAPAELLDVQLAAPEILPVDVGDLQFAAQRGFQAGGDLDHRVVVEIQTRDGEF